MIGPNRLQAWIVTCAAAFAILIESGGAAKTASPVSSAQNELAGTFLRVHQSLVYIKALKTGTGFVVGSGGGMSFILTAEHVVEGRNGCSEGDPVSVYIDDDLDYPVTGTVAKCPPLVDTGATGRPAPPTVDLALVRIPRQGLPGLHIAEEATEGTWVAVAGYPIASHSALGEYGELRPTLHDGVVSAVRLQGLRVEHNAVTDYGNSGGPLFDVKTGYVVGVVLRKIQSASGAYEATGFRAVQVFLDLARADKRLKFVPASAWAARQSPFSQVHGRDRLTYSFDFTPGSNSWNRVVKGFDRRLKSKLQRALGSGVTLRAQSEADARNAHTQIGLGDMRNVCRNAVGIFHIDVDQVKVRAEPGLQALVRLLDCRGNEKARVAPSPFPISEIDNKVKEMAGQLKDLLFIEEPSRFHNLLKYGMFIADGERLAGFSLCVRHKSRQTQRWAATCADSEVAVDGKSDFAVASYVDRGGPAWAAGLRPFDIITGIDPDPRKTLIGLTGTELELEDSGFWHLHVVRPDDSKVELCFRPQNLAWYIHHKSQTQEAWVSKSLCASLTPPPVQLAVDYSPVKVSGEAVLQTSPQVVTIEGGFDSTFGYVVEAVDEQHNPVRAVPITSDQFCVYGKPDTKVYWVAVGTAASYQSFSLPEATAAPDERSAAEEAAKHCPKEPSAP